MWLDVTIVQHLIVIYVYLLLICVGGWYFWYVCLATAVLYICICDRIWPGFDAQTKILSYSQKCDWNIYIEILYHVLLHC